MASMNNITLAGRVNSDIESISLEGQHQVTFLLSFPNWLREGEIWKTTDADITIICRGRIAELVSQLVKRDQHISIVGKLSKRFANKNGMSYPMISVTAYDFVLSVKEDTIPGEQLEQYKRASSLNTVSLLGNLGADPEHKSYQDSEKATFSIAINDWHKNQMEEWEKQTIWVRISTRGNKTDVVKRFLRKGNQVGIVGRLIRHTYQELGDIRVYTEISARDIILTNFRKENNMATENIDNSSFDFESGEGNITEKDSTKEKKDELPF